MPKLILRSETDELELDSVEQYDRGVQVLRGVTGLGLPPVAMQWLEGAGDGATFRGKRVLSRDIDLPLLVQGIDRADMVEQLRRLSIILSGRCLLLFQDDEDHEWFTEVHRVGGGDYDYGNDTIGRNAVQLLVTLRAGDPYFTSSVVSRSTVQSGSGGGLLKGSLASLNLSPSQTIGNVDIVNDGDAIAYPVWNVAGPGTDLRLVSPSGEELVWHGTLTAGQSLVIDTQQGTIVDQSGANRYAELGSRPRFWGVPPGHNTVAIEMLDSSPGTSKVEATWRIRKWLVI